MINPTEKIVIAVVVFDRIGNFIKWCKLAKLFKSQFPNSLEIRIVHNCNDLAISEKWKSIAEKFPVTYIRRNNVGLDIGVFQDVCKNSLQGFEDNYNYLLWFTDDCFPTSLNFLNEFLNPFENEKIGMSCMEVSTEIRPHARTTGFCIRKETLEKIVFPVPTITTKQDCYSFEHGQNNFYLQIKKLGFEVHEIKDVIFFNVDSKKIRKFGLEKALDNLYQLLFNYTEPNALVFATAYNRYPQIISSVICQKFRNFNLEIWYDGKIEDFDLQEIYESYEKNLGRFDFKEIRKEAKGNYGHHLKKEFLEKFDETEFDYLVITNEDNYISPYFLQKAIETLEQFPDKVGAYCSGMVHNYKPDTSVKPMTWREKKAITENHIVDGYGVIPTKIERGYIDIGALVLRSSVAKSIQWGDFSHCSDWDYIENIAKAYGGDEKTKYANIFISFPGVHFVHN